MAKKLWKKHIGLKKARVLSELFCEDFELDYCEVYYVDILNEAYGQYIYLQPPHMLVLDKPRVINKIGVVMHELVHHLEAQCYTIKSCESVHGYSYQLAKKRVIKWCQQNISKKPDWRIPFHARVNTDTMKKFKI